METWRERQNDVGEWSCQAGAEDEDLKEAGSDEEMMEEVTQEMRSSTVVTSEDRSSKTEEKYGV